MKSNKKAFTIVEVVIVIAIIAVLAAVLIPTFANIINKANVSKDTQLIRNLNTALASSRASNNNEEHKTLYDALQAAEAFGYDVGKINASATNAEILWDQENDVFCYLEGSNVVYLPELVDIGKHLATDNKPYHLWKIFDDKHPIGENTYGFSIYWNGAAQNEVIIDGLGFDAGTSSVTNIRYINNNAARDVVIRTNSYSTVLTIDAENDTVTHYGKANKVDITAVDNNNCYNEHGDIAGNINLKKGKVVVHKDCSAGAVVIDMTAAELATVTTLSADNSANKNVPIILNTSEVLWGANPHNGLINPTTNNIIYSSTGGTLPENFDSMTNEQKEAAIADASSSLIQGVAAIKNTGYPTLEAAVDAAQNDDTIILLGDILLNEGLIINKKITLNMNGKTISGNHDPLIVVGSSVLSYQAAASSYTHEGNLTVRGNGSISNSTWDAIVVYPDAEVNIFDGYYRAYAQTLYSRGGRLNTYGGTFTAYYAGASGNILVNCTLGGTANLYGGTFVTPDNGGCYGVYLSTASEVNLGVRGGEGPTFSTWRPCICTNGSKSHAGNVNVYSGTFRANRNNTTIDDQTVIQLANATAETQTINIYGGYFEQTSHLENSCIFTLKYSGTINMNISGGTFNTGNSKYFCGYGTSGSGYPSTSNIRVNVQNNAIPRNVTVEVYGSGVVRVPEYDFVVNP